MGFTDVDPTPVKNMVTESRPGLTSEDSANNSDTIGHNRVMGVIPSTLPDNSFQSRLQEIFKDLWNGSNIKAGDLEVLLTTPNTAEDEEENDERQAEPTPMRNFGSSSNKVNTVRFKVHSLLLFSKSKYFRENVFEKNEHSIALDRTTNYDRRGAAEPEVDSTDVSKIENMLTKYEPIMLPLEVTHEAFKVNL
ncbi:unnamed protein product [Gordionus sp. m RMFG-2023]